MSAAPLPAAAPEEEEPAEAAPPPRPAAPLLAETIDLRQNRTTLFATLLVGATVCATLGGLWFGRFAQTESVRGVVAATGGFVRLDAPRAGVVSRLAVTQGDRVAAGSPVYALRLGAATAGGESVAEAEIRNLLQTRRTQEAEAAAAEAFIAQATRQQKAIESDQSRFYAGLDAQSRQVAAAADKSRAIVRRVSAYVKEGYATRDVLEARERTTYDYERQLAEIELRRLEYQRQDTERRRAYETLVATKQSQKAAARSQIESIDSRIAALRTESALEIQAPSAGTVLALGAKVGDSVRSGQLVAAIGDPAAAPLIVVEAPSRAVGLAKVGQRVILKYDAFPYKTFGIHHGTITYISEAAVRAPVTEGLPPEAGLDPRPVPMQSAYRIEIRPDRADVDAYGEKVPLKIGATLSVDIVVERRRLIDWATDPIRALRGR
ncbi:HlyD family secretion protein [Methylobacterium sp. 4-46]|uniref:HlyD family secretion protein n=1 Tax=unclassified Methylobacterium TaxID=2615210 RepID=UPI000165C911|nr:MULTISPECIES: HlyD family efflux transporter periplasmic adaptor subunit [Methylobacterium]ACA18136.1 HlyD family secretion protein [Methylobacterium sp. 4-46]WFT77434.1 HlyD family efflux transporter periplasmic adaptor subunit [Methylobacterium nodulans]